MERNKHIVRFTPERSQAMARQSYILHAPAIIEVPRDMYRRGSLVDAELR